jgi:hypothetical protein
MISNWYARVRVRGFSEALLFLPLLWIISSLIANAAVPPKSVFVKAACSGKLGSVVLNTFKEELRTSPKYQPISTLDDNGQMDVVIRVQMSCAEHETVTAVATVYGVAKCFGFRDCHVTMDGNSLTVILCDSNAIGDCGRVLFRSFDGYVSSLNTTPLKLE